MNENEEVKQEADLKQETVKTFNEAKEQMKNINFKEEAEVGKGLLKKLWKNPVETIKEIADDKENKTFKTALLLVAAWAVIVLVNRILYYAMSKYAEFEFLPTLKVMVAPILRVLAMTIALFFINNKAKESISKILTSVSIAFVPSMIYSLLAILGNISSNMYDILSPISGLLAVISTILMFHTVKAFNKEESDEKILKHFIKVEAVYYVIVFAVSFLGINI